MEATHLHLDRLGPDVALTVEERSHLTSCPRCRIDARWMAAAGSQGAVDGAEAARDSLAGVTARIAGSADTSLSGGPTWSAPEDRVAVMTGEGLLFTHEPPSGTPLAELDGEDLALALDRVVRAVDALHRQGLHHGGLGADVVHLLDGGDVVLGRPSGRGDRGADWRSVAALLAAQIGRVPNAAGLYPTEARIGRGGMAEVRRVVDRRFGRRVALKQLLPEVAAHPEARRRFEREARVTASLQHPGIPPVYDAGVLDGRAFFTMREVDGRPLSRAVATGAWPLRRRVDVFVRVAQTVAFAHSRSIVHRDLKPANVLVGDYGEVVVVDWGLAKHLGEADDGPLASDLAPAAHTSFGTVLGTAAYMPPEQAAGDLTAVDLRADVYALGAMLYELLGGQPPYTGPSSSAILVAVRAGPPPPLPEAVPDELRQICDRAMSRDPDGRHPDASALAFEVEAWLDGARRRDRALEVVARASEADRRAGELQREARTLRDEARNKLPRVRRAVPVEALAEGWELEDRAGELEIQAQVARAEADGLLHAALVVDPDLPEAHAALAARHRAAHEAAETDREPLAAAAAAVHLRAHAEHLPEAWPTRRDHLAYLAGDGALTLHTTVPATCALYRLVARRRRLEAVFERDLGSTPIVSASLPQGSWLVRIRAPGCDEVVYPVRIGRGAHWNGAPPGATEPEPVWLPPEGRLGPDVCYVPAGPFLTGGGDPSKTYAVPWGRAWCPGFVMGRFPVTQAEYLAFLNDLVARGTDPTPRLPRGYNDGGTEGPTGYVRDHDGRIRLDEDGQAWNPRWPVFLVDHDDAVAYVEWRAERDGLPWRLPMELEWEKAARGVDGRRFPWGEAYAAAWANCEASLPTPNPCPVDDFPDDVSVYGVRGLGGNTRDWCADAFVPEGPLVEAGRVVILPASRASHVARRGGTWHSTLGAASSITRFRSERVQRWAHVGFRLVRGVPDGLAGAD